MIIVWASYNIGIRHVFLCIYICWIQLDSKEIMTVQMCLCVSISSAINISYFSGCWLVDSRERPIDCSGMFGNTSIMAAI